MEPRNESGSPHPRRNGDFARPYGATLRRSALRVLRVGTSTMLVYEPPDAGHVLVFETALSLWHVTRFPDDWNSLSDAELLALRSGV
jgi:hypothetical protein